jgi:hypothetical protein
MTLLDRPVLILRRVERGALCVPAGGAIHETMKQVQRGMTPTETCIRVVLGMV